MSRKVGDRSHRRRPDDDAKHDDEEEQYLRSLTPGPIRSANGWVLFVTGLGADCREDDLFDVFAEFGHVKAVKMNYDRRTGIVKGYALVEFEKRSEGQDAINRLHGSRFMGTIIGVHWAFVKPTGSSR